VTDSFLQKLSEFWELATAISAANNVIRNKANYNKKDNIRFWNV